MSKTQTKRYRIRKITEQWIVYDTSDNEVMSYFTFKQDAADWALYLNAMDIEDRL